MKKQRTVSKHRNRKMSWLAGKITLSLLILGSNQCLVLGDLVPKDWWETTLVYEIWTPTFQDSDGDGIGDFQGIINRLNYLDDLGIDTICLNSIFASPLVGSSLDVSDYKNVNEVFGDLSDFEELVQAVHARNMKIILDVEPNHTSDKHEWFDASTKMMEPFKDYYIWANGTVTPEGILAPPRNPLKTIDNHNIISSPWTYNEDREQWYYHTFTESEPDLNLENPYVQRDIMEIFGFWLNKSVDGFRISGVPHFFENFELSNHLPAPGEEHVSAESKNVKFLSTIRTYVNQWPKTNDSDSKYLMAGSYDTDEHLLSYYDDGNNDTTSVVPSNYCFIKSIAIAGSSASELGRDIETWLDRIPMNETTNWMLSTSGSMRITTRVGPDRLDALLMLSMLLPGQAHTFYGDEIGLLDTPIPSDDIDHSAHDFNVTDYFEYNSPIASMQWDDSPSAGFSNATIVQMPVNPNYDYVNVAKQLDDLHSHLNVYKKLVALRKSPVFRYGDWEIENMNNDTIFVLRRTLTNHPIFVLVINLANTEQIVNMTDLYPDLNIYLDVVVTSGKDEISTKIASRNLIPVLPNVGIVLRSEHIENSAKPEIVFSHEGKETKLVEARKGQQVKENEQQKAHQLEEKEEGIIEPGKVEEEKGRKEIIEPAKVEGRAQEEIIEPEKVEEEEREEIIEPEKVIGATLDERGEHDGSGEKPLIDEIERERLEIETEETFEEKTESNRKVEEAKPTGEEEEVDEEANKLPDQETSEFHPRSIEETSEILGKELFVKMKNENDDDVGKQTHDNLQVHVDPAQDSELQRRSAASAVSAGNTSEIVNSSLITLVIIANYVIARVL